MRCPSNNGRIHIFLGLVPAAGVRLHRPAQSGLGRGKDGISGAGRGPPIGGQGQGKVTTIHFDSSATSHFFRLITSLFLRDSHRPYLLEVLINTVQHLREAALLRNPNIQSQSLHLTHHGRHKENFRAMQERGTSMSLVHITHGYHC
jgi:hypothetical protein